MKKTLKGILSGILALVLVLSAFSGALAEIARELPVSEHTGEVRSGALDDARSSGRTAAYGTAALRQGRTFAAADVQPSDDIEPTDIVTIMVELPEAPAADVVENLRNAGSYREQLVASQKQAAALISSKLGVEVNVQHNYSVLFNGFSFDGEYRLVEQIEALEGMHAFVSMEWESPDLYNSTSMVGAIEAWDLGYSGKGYTVAVLDTGCKVDHPAFSVMPDESAVQFTQDDIAVLIEEGNFHGSTSEGGMDASEVYYNAKIPFRWNYYYQHADAAHPGTSDHGTHVAGIATGNNDEIKGVAPDAQLAVMQVFAPGGTASWNNILPALEDCAILGVAAANLSLGSTCGREAFYDPSYEETLERCVDAGVNLSISAGNAYDSAKCNRWGGNFGVVTSANLSSTGYALVNTPDFGVVGSPSTWPHGLSVAAVENSMSRGYYIEVDGVKYAYSENGANPVKLADALGGETYEYVMVPGVGNPEDFEQVDVEGKIAVVIRGGISFVIKADNAAAAGAVACVIYNNTSGTLSMVAYTGDIPHVALTQADGLAIAEVEDKQMFVSDEVGLMEVSAGHMTTAFSSRGFTANMAMKPEITAPGGQIYSSTDPGISGVSYDTWNGTSMSAPHVGGGMAIVSEYVDNKFPNASMAEKQALVNAILMSTATPIYGPSGEYAPVHQQGAGEMNLKKATTTTAYLTVEGTKGDRPKLNLGDDPEKTGEYTGTFTVHNFGDSDLSYAVTPTVLLNDISILSYLDGEPVIIYNGNTYAFELGMPGCLLGDVDMDGEITAFDGLLITRYSMDIARINNIAFCDVNGDGQIGLDDAVLAIRIALGVAEPMYSEATEGEVNFDMPATVKVPAGETVDFTFSFTVTDDIKEYLDTYYTAGAMIEGFVELIPTLGENSLTIPFIKYFGDWNYPATLDIGYYYEDTPWNSNNFPNTAGFQTGDGTVYGLGINPYVETEDLSYYLEDRNAISPNGDRFLDTLNLVYAGLLRNSVVRYTVCDTEGNEIHEIFEATIDPKGHRTNGGDRSQLGVTYQSFPGNFDFTQFQLEDVVVRITADLDNDGNYTTNEFTPEANEHSFWDIPIHVDTQAPTISNVYVSGNGVTFDATDDHYVAAVMVMDEDGELVSAQGVFETERGASTNVTVQLEVGQYVIVADYAGNEQWFEFVGSPLVPIDPPELGPQLVYSMGFNTTDDLAGWNVVDKDGDGANWGMRSSGNIYEGDRCMSSVSYQRTPDNWLLAPAIELPEGAPYLTFMARGNYSTAYEEHFAVYIAPVGTPSVDDYVEIFPETVATNAYQQFTVDLSEYAGQNVRIALRHFNTYNMNYLTMDLWQIWN
ncbi:MAG: S8 family serine peptidase [Clostridia bacterium]|nr:S8 family serine peptidase [Clostridia bacterium]